MNIGDELPTVEIPITTTLIVTGALASRDFQDVHHDAEVAKASGAKDVFTNILTTQGLVGRYVTDWAEPGSMIAKMSIRLGVPNYPHDVMTLTGSVLSIEGARITLRIRGANSLGDHVSGTVEVERPR